MMRYPYTVLVTIDDSAKCDSADREAHAEDIRAALNDWDIPVAAIGWSENDEYKPGHDELCGDESCDLCYETAEEYAGSSTRGCALGILIAGALSGLFWFGLFELVKAVAK